MGCGTSSKTAEGPTEVARVDLGEEAIERLIADKMKDRKWDDFEILNTLGEGGEGEVFTARDKIDGRWVVIKAMKGTEAGFDKEAKLELATILSLDHPNVAGLDFIFRRIKDDKEQDLCYSMPVAWHGDLYLRLI